jgi:hypothetical protein
MFSRSCGYQDGDVPDEVSDGFAQRALGVARDRLRLFVQFVGQIDGGAHTTL